MQGQAGGVTIRGRISRCMCPAAPTHCVAIVDTTLTCSHAHLLNPRLHTFSRLTLQKETSGYALADSASAAASPTAAAMRASVALPAVGAMAASVELRGLNCEGATAINIPVTLMSGIPRAHAAAIQVCRQA